MKRSEKDLCFALMKTDKQSEVIDLLKEADLWDEPSAWRFYDDNENNYSTIGNQQSHPDAALVEKLVNSIDARLISECYMRKIDPEGDNAPISIRDAVAQFFEENPSLATAGILTEWSDKKRTEIATGITLSATGASARKGNLCLSIADCGEGQTPKMMPNTFLSLSRANKLRIPFVQGVFNMGGTGVLKFCGDYKLQLILSRRNQALLKNNSEDSSDTQWGFTIVRREEPSQGRRNSVYTYLAPVNSSQTPRKGEVLKFSSDTMPIFPDGRDPYKKEAKWGTLIKLYEYATKHRTHMFRKSGVLGRLDLLLSNPALPIRLYECRSEYGGHEGSFETNLTGIQVRLEDKKQENLEKDFPATASLVVSGEQMTIKIYAFKKGAAETYRKNEGIIFTVNGQTHGHLTTDFFKRKKVGLSYLADSLLVIVDCSRITKRSREDLFMNSRDRLSGGDLREALEDALEDELRNNQLLRDLTERRKRELMKIILGDSKPLLDTLRAILKKYPTLSKLFLEGKSVPTPFKTESVVSKEKDFEGKKFPTYFKFKGRDYKTQLKRECHKDSRCRIFFETDATNDYFDREIDNGETSVFLINNSCHQSFNDRSLSLQNGIATLSIRLPDTVKVGDELKFVCKVNDRTRIEPFENYFSILIKEPADTRGAPGSRKKPPGENPGSDREIPSGIIPPEIKDVTEREWAEQDPPFDKYTALRIRFSGKYNENVDEIPDIYDFYVNIDNIYLQSEIKTSHVEQEILKERFKTGLVLIGLAMIQFRNQQEKAKLAKADDEDDENGDQNNNFEDEVENTTKALSSILLPMIDHLGSIASEEQASIDYSAESA